MERFSISPDRRRPETLGFYLILIPGCHIWGEMAQISSLSPAHLFSDERTKEPKFLREDPEHLGRKRMLWFFPKVQLKRLSPNRRANSYILGYGQETRSQGRHIMVLIWFYSKNNTLERLCLTRSHGIFTCSRWEMSNHFPFLRCSWEYHLMTFVEPLFSGLWAPGNFSVIISSSIQRGDA